VDAQSPNVTYLQKFGVQAYVLDQTPNKDKFVPKGIESIFIGYSETSKTYGYLPRKEYVHPAM